MVHWSQHRKKYQKMNIMERVGQGAAVRSVSDFYLQICAARGGKFRCKGNILLVSINYDRDVASGGEAYKHHSCRIGRA